MERGTAIASFPDASKDKRLRADPPREGLRWDGVLGCPLLRKQLLLSQEAQQDNRVDGSEREVMETDAGADMATARTLFLALYPGIPNSEREAGLEGESPCCLTTCFSRSFPGGVSGKESTCRHRRHKSYEFNRWVRKIPWRGTATHSSILTWRIPWTEEIDRL